MLAQDVRRDIDQVWDTFWSAGVTNPIVVSDLLGTLLMAGVTRDSWERLRIAAIQEEGDEIARELAIVRRQFAIDSGSEIEAAEFWSVGHSLVRAMDLLYPVVEAHGDVLGDIYEHILSKLSLAGHFGQFRTPRHIVDFMVELLDPQEGEVVADPACGSAGFLVAASDYRSRAGRSGKELGVEIDRTISRIARANTVFHGMKDGVILHGDGLTLELPHSPNVVLANPPFAGVVSTEVASRFQAGSSKTELLFVEAIAGSLAAGGRAAVVVPSGVITGRGAAAIFVRKQLLEENTLEAVIELPSGVFRPYTDVKTAILVWRNSPSEHGAKVKMIRVDADGFSLDSRRMPVPENDMPGIVRLLRGEAVVPLAVADIEVARIAATDYNLNPTRYIDVKSSRQEMDSPSLERSLAQLSESVHDISVILSRIEGVRK